MMLMIILFAMMLKKGTSIYDYEAIIIDRKFYITIAIILLSLLYRVEMSGMGFTFEGVFYRLFVAPLELLNKM